MAILDILTLKLLENEAQFRDTTLKFLENFLAHTSLNSTLSLIPCPGDDNKREPEMD